MYGTSGNFNFGVIIDHFLNRVLKPYKQSQGFHRLELLWDHATCHLTKEVKDAMAQANVRLHHVPKRLTNLLQPADVGWMRHLKIGFHHKWNDWMTNGVHTYTAAGNLRSPGIDPTKCLLFDSFCLHAKCLLKGYMRIIEWISQIWDEFERQRIIDSFDCCGITEDAVGHYHLHLRHFMQSNELTAESTMTMAQEN